MSGTRTQGRRRVVVLLVATLGCVSGAEAGARSDEPPAPTPSPLDARARALALLSELDRAPDDGLTHETPIDDPEGVLARAVAAGLDRASRGDGALRLAFFGSSHVAGDLVTGFLRERLQRHFGDAGHGYVTAVPPYGAYWQWGVSVADGEGWSVAEPTSKDMTTGAYGLTGMGFDAIEPAWAAAATERTSASHLEVFFLRQPAGGELALSIDGVARTLDTSFERTAAGIERIDVADGEHRIEVRADGRAPTRLYGFAFERDGPGVVVDQLGVNGMTPAIALLSDQAVMHDLLAARRPDVIAVWFGANEATEPVPVEEQAARLRTLLMRVAAAAPSAACLVVGPLDRRQHTPDGTPFVPAALPALLDVHRLVAEERGCAYFDAFGWQGGTGAVERFESAAPPLVRSDRLHLSHTGYLRLGASLLRALLAPLAAPSDR